MTAAPRKRRPGRPLTGEPVRSARMTLRLTPEEAADVRAQAKHAKRPLSEHLRRLILRSAE